MAASPSIIGPNNAEPQNDVLIRLKLQLELVLARERLALTEAKLQAGNVNIREIEARTKGSDARTQMYRMEAEMYRAQTAAINAGFKQNAAGEWVAPQVQELPENDGDNSILEVDDDGYHSEAEESFRSRSNSRSR